MPQKSHCVCILRLRRSASDSYVHGHTVALDTLSEGVRLVQSATRLALHCFVAHMQLVLGPDIGDRQSDADDDDRDQQIPRTHLTLTGCVLFFAAPSSAVPRVQA